MIQKTLSVGPLQCNCQILVCPETFQAVVVDPGDEPQKILKTIASLEAQLGGQKISVKALLHTHAHFDHIGASRGVVETLRACGIEAPNLVLHKDDEFIYSMLERQGQMFGFEFQAPLPIDRFVADGEELNFGSLKMKVIHTPGHSPGGICFHLQSDLAKSVPEMVFTGDTLFRRSVGRSDLWGGDEKLLAKSIKDRLFVLDDDTTAWPGHGLATRIGEEKRENPYVGSRS